METLIVVFAGIVSVVTITILIMGARVLLKEWNDNADFFENLNK